MKDEIKITGENIQIERTEITPVDTEKAKKKGKVFGDPVVIIE